jgi:DNA-binding protein H-NS
MVCCDRWHGRRNYRLSLSTSVLKGSHVTVAVRSSKKLNLDSMSIDEVWHLHEEIIRVLLARLTAEKRELEKRLARLSRETGKMTRPDPAESELKKDIPGKQRKYPRVLPKYRNPDERSETWSGRGKQPRCMTRALQAGRTIEEFVIGSLELNRNNAAGQRSETL